MSGSAGRSVGSRAGSRRVDRLDALLVLLIGGLAALSVATLVQPGIAILSVDRVTDVAFPSMSAAIALALSVLLFPRYREDGRLTRLWQVAAWVMLAGVIVVQRLTIVLGADRGTGFAVEAQGRIAPWLTLLVAGSIAAVLVAAAWSAAAERRRMVRHPRIAAFAPVVVLIAVEILLVIVAPPLPDFLSPGATELVRGATDTAAVGELIRAGLVRPGPEAALIRGLVALAVLLAARWFRAAYRRDGPPSSGHLAVALVLLAFAQLQEALVPGYVSGLVTWFDLLVLGAISVAFLGLVAEEREDNRRLRGAAVTERRLREAVAERAMLEERARVAREVHDGLAQSLWLLDARLDRIFARAADEDPEVAEARTALAATREDARALVAAMRRTEAAIGLDEVIRSLAREVVGAAGPAVDVSVGPEVPADLAPGTLAELRAIVREALVNVLRHADATLIRIEARAEDDALLVRVTDNGLGFVPGQERQGSWGLRGMQERAAVLGGQVSVSSEPEGGTEVAVRVPLLRQEIGEGPEEGGR